MDVLKLALGFMITVVHIAIFFWVIGWISTKLIKTFKGKAQNKKAGKENQSNNKGDTE